MSQQLVDSDGQYAPDPKYVPGTAASNLGCLLYVFCEGPFVEEVRTFVRCYAPWFSPACIPPDGSHPLQWTELHVQFRQLFEKQLDASLAKERISRDELVSYCAELKAVCDKLGDGDTIPASGGLKVAGFRTFLDNLTASEEYDSFLTVMQAAAATLPAPEPPAVEVNQAAAPPPPQQPETVQVNVQVPEGIAECQIIAIEYGGLRYEVPVPPGFPPGSVFSIAVAAPVASPATTGQ